jgi:hypothetical protein
VGRERIQDLQPIADRSFELEQNQARHFWKAVAVAISAKDELQGLLAILQASDCRLALSVTEAWESESSTTRTSIDDCIVPLSQQRGYLLFDTPKELKRSLRACQKFRRTHAGRQPSRL